MTRVFASVLTVLLIVGLAAPAAQAGSTADVALGLAAFAVFSQLAGPMFYSPPASHYVHRHYHPVVYAYPQVYAVPYQVVVVPPPPPPQPTVIQYPHGRYELRGDGVTTAYHWVWIPNPPPPPAAPPPSNPR